MESLIVTSFGCPLTLTDAIQDASLGEILRALTEASLDRDGLAFDVAEALFQRNYSKEFPGPDPSDIEPKHPNVGEVLVRTYDPNRREDAIRAFREIWNHSIPTFDENDPKWLKATKAERKAARQAAERWVRFPELDRVPQFLASMDANRENPTWHGWCRYSSQPDASHTREEAEAEVARWATYGVTATVRGFEPTPTSHRRTLQQHLCRGPIG